MSPRRTSPAPPSARRTANALAAIAGQRIREARQRRGWTLDELATRSSVSRSAAHAAESGIRCSLEMLAALAAPLGLRVELDLVSARRTLAPPAGRASQDFVHAAMGELLAAHLRQLGFGVAIDEPCQHFRFAGRADVLAWSREPPALLHIENRTRFPNLQEAAGAWNAKRAYLAPVVAERLGLRGVSSITHVMACLWSAEVLHVLRMRAATFRSLCPDPPDSFEGWWAGTPPPAGTSATFILLDPLATARQRLWVGLDVALATARPRVHGYAEAAQRLSSTQGRGNRSRDERALRS
jgi:transcriptional regulator with XRE-family HTH domain